ncbi:hypothetical protein GTP58_06580 [Duganella sp. CY15W]|uniref:transcriptional repressor n=1 Tax=Duganella sp. CY15W TaxID=2692172 RepID=UPI00136B233C|nr:transcriptional repressor [Duganella sp. CY15W]MYM27982.1 hypothetical protein [Duganella sp. CY15W]
MMEHGQLAEDEAVYAQLRKLKLRPTSARICVLTALQQQREEALPAERIFLQLIQTGVTISLGTVYRVLTELEQHGLVQREWPPLDPAGKSRFMLIPVLAAPMVCSMVCPLCQSEHAVTDKLLLEALRRQARAAGFERGLAATAITLMCDRCTAGS